MKNIEGLGPLGRCIELEFNRLRPNFTEVEAYIPGPKFTEAGMYVLVVEPIPSWPYWFKPQHITAPCTNNTQVWANPAAKAVALPPWPAKGQLMSDQMHIWLFSFLYLDPLPVWKKKSDPCVYGDLFIFNFCTHVLLVPSHLLVY